MAVTFYRDPNLPFFEIKDCDTVLHSSKEHAHEEFSIGLVKQGSSMVNGFRGEFLVRQGSVIIIPPAMMHRCNPEDISHWQFAMLYLKADWVQSLLDTKPRELPIATRTLDANDYQRFCKLLIKLRADLPALEKEATLITELHYFFNFETYFQQKPVLENQPQVIRKVREYFQVNFLDKISLDNLAAVSGLTKYHLLRCFKKAYHTSPHSYQTLLRVNYAKKELLKRKEAPIITIAQDAGFYDQSHFVKTFKQYYGITPWDYRIG